MDIVDLEEWAVFPSINEIVNFGREFIFSCICSIGNKCCVEINIAREIDISAAVFLFTDHDVNASGRAEATSEVVAICFAFGNLCVVRSAAIAPDVFHGQGLGLPTLVAAVFLRL